MNARLLDRFARVAASLGLFAVTFVLLDRSPFRSRLREDVPSVVPGLPGVEGLVLVAALVLATAPLLAGRRFVGAFLVSSFFASGIGAHWWTLLPWEDLVKESRFPGAEPPGLTGYLMVASPILILAAYCAVAAPLRMLADWEARGVDPSEAVRAAQGTAAAGVAALGGSLVLVVVMWFALSRGVQTVLVGVLPGGVSLAAGVAFAGAAAWIFRERFRTGPEDAESVEILERWRRGHAAPKDDLRR